MIVRKAVWSMVGMTREDGEGCCKIQMLRVLVDLITAGVEFEAVGGDVGIRKVDLNR
jgi:hypothetical protein